MSIRNAQISTVVDLGAALDDFSLFSSVVGLSVDVVGVDDTTGRLGGGGGALRSSSFGAAPTNPVSSSNSPTGKKNVVCGI